MAFTQEPTKGPQGIYSLSVFTKYAADFPVIHMLFEIEVQMTDGSIVRRKGELRPHLTQNQIDTIENFLANLVAQATTEIVGS